MAFRDREAARLYMKEYRAKSDKWKERHRERQRERRKAMRKWYRAYKATLECGVCGENHPACLDFHHLEDKNIEVSRCLQHGWSVERTLKEIEKCSILCANCHRKLHYGLD